MKGYKFQKYFFAKLSPSFLFCWAEMVIDLNFAPTVHPPTHPHPPTAMNLIMVYGDLSHLINNLPPLTLKIWLYSVSIFCPDLSPMMNNLSHLASHIMPYSE